MKDARKVRIGGLDVDERARVKALDRLKRDIKSWARERKLWLDCAFHTPHLYHDEVPKALRLYQSGATPELVTVVQAKRYRTRPITLDSVAALVGVGMVENAQRAIFATTSRFLPSAKAFAETASTKLAVDLADSTRVAGWCAEIAEHLTNFYSQGIQHDPLYAAKSPQTELIGKIVTAEHGYNCRFNAFAVIEGDFRHDVILCPIGSRAITPDPNDGLEIADESALVSWTKQARLAATKRRDNNGRMTFSTDRKDFHLWDGSPLRHHAD